MQFTIITCSGVSNTGKLTTQTGARLMQRNGESIESCLAVTCSSNSLEKAMEQADQILVLDGCTDCCGMKKLKAHGIERYTHIIATECGIEKKGMAKPEFYEIERLAAAVMDVIRE